MDNELKSMENETQNNERQNVMETLSKRSISAKKIVEKNVIKGTTKASLLMSVAPFIFIGVSVAFVIAMLAGIAVFLNTLPGISMAQLKKYGKEMANSLASWFGDSTTEQVDDSLVYSTLDYLEEIGYDLNGYGFITEKIDSKDVDLSKDVYDEETGVARDKETGKISMAKSDFLMSYLISDNYVYTVANQNLDIDSEDGDFFSWLKAKTSALGRHVSEFFGGSLGPHWTTGLITLWNEDGGVGHRGSYYSDKGLFNFDKLQFDSEKRTMTLKKGLLGTEMKYKIEGWAGRYGMPMEFLLSVHLATMMPDLAYDMANSFETKVNIILHPSGDVYIPYVENVINHWYRNVYYTSVSYNENNEKDGKELNFVDYDYEYEDIMKERWTLYDIDEDGNKKAVTISSDDVSNVKWEPSGDLYTAYKVFEGGGIIQNGDAQRGETNPKIKKMFLENTYFRYNGSSDTADAIKDFRDTYSVGYGALDDVKDLNGKDYSEIKTVLEDESGEKNTYKLSDVSGKVTLSQDSLNAFSMLENTDTLDADYIYRDFKELVYELGYFEKEDLTDRTPRLLAWIIPEIGFNGYPKRELDKKDNEFGTLLHSKKDYLAYERAVSKSSDEDELGIRKAKEDEGKKKNNDGSANREKSKKKKKGSKKDKEVSVINALQSVSGRKNYLASSQEEGYFDKVYKQIVTEDFEGAGWDDILPTVLSWGKKFNYSTAPNVAYQMNNEKEYIEWLESLGGVFAEYAGADKHADGTGDGFVDGCKYTYGLMDIAGTAYCNGYGDYETLCTPYMSSFGGNSAVNPYDGYYGTGGTSHECVRGHSSNQGIDYCMLTYDFLTCCNITVDKVYFKAGLFGGEGQPRSSCNAAELVNVYGGVPVTEAMDLHLGDLIECFDGGNYLSKNPSDWGDWGHVFFVGEEYEDELVLYTTGSDYTNTGSFRRVIKKTASRSEVSAHDGWVGIHLFDLDVTKDKYEGYKGNEAVISPVTGVLLEYGTYKKKDGERVNVDILYDSTIDDTDKDGNQIEYTIERQEYRDRLGYAKIMVLDTKTYRMLEAKTNNRWANDTLVEEGKKSNSDSVVFRNDLFEEKDYKDWTRIDKTVYGYKEFLENYEKFGIAGNIIYIDGFKCEKVDPDFVDGEGKYPEGEEIKIDDYQKTLEDVENNTGLMDSKYRPPNKEYSNSVELEKRINAENKVKKMAATAFSLDDTILIKEGTILGRTLTDRELLEKDRKGKLGTYEELRENVDEETCGVIGNYIRIIMRDDATDSVIENVEDYFKAPEPLFKEMLGATVVDGDSRGVEPKPGTMDDPEVRDIVDDPEAPNIESPQDIQIVKIGGKTYTIIGQNGTFGSKRLRDGRTFSEGGCGPVALCTALYAFGYRGDPVLVNKAGSDVTATSHAIAVNRLKAQGKIPSSVRVIVHEHKDLPNNADDFYNEVRDALLKEHVVVMDMREGDKSKGIFGNVYGPDSPGWGAGQHAHWAPLIAYFKKTDEAFVANTCGERKAYSLRKMMDATFEAVANPSLTDEGTWVGTWIEICKD